MFQHQQDQTMLALIKATEVHQQNQTILEATQAEHQQIIEETAE
jgi:hypothetical protein